MGDSQVTIKLTSDEALVLSHWLENLQMTDLSRVCRRSGGLGADPSDRRDAGHVTRWAVRA